MLGSLSHSRLERMRDRLVQRYLKYLRTAEKGWLIETLGDPRKSENLFEIENTNLEIAGNDGSTVYFASISNPLATYNRY